MEITSRAAQHELALRSSRSSLIPYVKLTTPRWIEGHHLLRIASVLESIERREILRHIIITPPRHGKSTLISQRFPAWYISRNPRHEIIHASFGGELVTGFGRELRNLMKSDVHRAVFPGVTLSVDSRAAHLWSTNHGGKYAAAGVGGSITGRGADLLIIDDPVKGIEEAHSDIRRERIWNWWLNDAYSRLHEDAPVIIVTTRWHEDDLVGRILHEGKEEWGVTHFKAIDDDGKPLWPEKISLRNLELKRHVTTPAIWQCLYQGQPTAEEGNFFNSQWLRDGKPPPIEEMVLYGASDYAVRDSGGDYTVHMVTGLDGKNRIWVLDIWRKQADSSVWVKEFLRLVKRWQPLAWAEEKGQIEKAVGPWIQREMMRDRAWVRRIPFASVRDKASRARAIQGAIAVDGLWMDKGSSWYRVFEEEMLQFPRGRNDDQVDSLSLIGRMLAGMNPRFPKEEAPVVPQALTLNQVIEGHEVFQQSQEWL